MNYGLPYKGSKSKICDFLVSNFPDSHTFVDVFSGGCSVTHKCMLEQKYKNYIIKSQKVLYSKSQVLEQSVRNA